MFKFQLEPVLSLKEKFEESKKRELGAEIQKQNVILSERTALLHNQHALLDEMKAQSIQTVHVNELKLCGHYAKALEKAKELIKKLDEGASFEELAKENSSDSSASDGGNIGYFNRGKTVAEFEDASVKLKVGEYTKEPVKTQFGYHIILKTDQKEKPAFDEVKDSIKDTLVSEKISNTENIYVYAMEWLREKNDLKIYDAELKIKYDHYMNEQKASSTKK